MPGAIITINPEDYPSMAEIEDGENVTLEVQGTKTTDEDGNAQIETTSIKQTNSNPAKKALKSMKKGGSPASSAPAEDSLQEEDLY